LIYTKLGLEWIAFQQRLTSVSIPESKRNSPEAWETFVAEWKKIIENKSSLYSRFDEHLEDELFPVPESKPPVVRRMVDILMMEQLLSTTVFSMPKTDTEFGRSLNRLKEKIQHPDQDPARRLKSPEQVYEEILEAIKANDLREHVSKYGGPAEPSRKQASAVRSEFPARGRGENQNKDVKRKREHSEVKGTLVEGCMVCRKKLPKSHKPQNCRELLNLKTSGRMDDFNQWMDVIKQASAANVVSQKPAKRMRQQEAVLPRDNVGMSNDEIRRNLAAAVKAVKEVCHHVFGSQKIDFLSIEFNSI
jgi:hypothetical protein